MGSAVTQQSRVKLKMGFFDRVKDHGERVKGVVSETVGNGGG